MLFTFFRLATKTLQSIFSLLSQYTINLISGETIIFCAMSTAKGIRLIMKIAVIGGGGVRSMFLAKSLTQRASELNIDKIVFMDNNEKKLRIYGAMAKQVANQINPLIQFTLTTDAVEAVRNADYIITTIRVGEDSKRVDDEKIALSHNILGQETTGAAGFSFAMRSVPALAEYCELIKNYSSKNVKVFNFTNPVGVVSQTLRDMGYNFTFGICDAPSSLLRSFAKLYDVESDAITGNCFGLNHLSFFNSICLNGKEILQELIDNKRLYTETRMCFFDQELSKNIGCIMNEYLYYFFYREKAVDNILRTGTTRGEVIGEINIHMTEELSKMNIENNFDDCLKVFEKWYGQRENSYMKNETGITSHKIPFKFDINQKDEGGYAGVALKCIEADQKKQSTEMIMCLPNNGSIPELYDDDIVEISCTVSPDGYVPHKIEFPAEIPMEIIRRVKIYERLASQAIRTRSKKTAIECLMMHPLVNSYSLAKELVEQYIKSNQNYINEWS
jgi:6-phospho-beta-glucosidase